jgi:hypothetical protein
MNTLGQPLRLMHFARLPAEWRRGSAACDSIGGSIFGFPLIGNVLQNPQGPKKPDHRYSANR